MGFKSNDFAKSEKETKKKIDNKTTDNKDKRILIFWDSSPILFFGQKRMIESIKMIDLDLFRT